MSSEGRFPYDARRPLLAVAVALLGVTMPSVTEGQTVPTPSCSSSVRSVPLDRNYLIDARAVVGVDGQLLMFGQMAGRIDRTTTTPTLDSSIVGIVSRFDGAARGIPAPRPGMRVTDAKAIAVAGGGVRIFYHLNDRFSEQEPFELWTGLLEGTRWSGVRRLGAFGNAVFMGAEVSDGPIEWNGSSAFAFAQDTGGIALVLADRDSVKVSRLRTSLWGEGDVSLAVQGDELWLAVAAGGPETRDFGDIYVGKMRGDSLVDVRRIAVGGQRQLRQPRLLTTSEGLVLAWITEDPASGVASLGWRGLADPGAPENQLPARWPITRGGFPHTHLLAVPLSDRTAMVAELLPKGIRRIATIESRVLAPALGGDSDHLYAVSWGANPTVPSSSQVVLHDLSCGVAAARSSARP